MFLLNSPMDLTVIDDLYVEGISTKALVIDDIDYDVFQQTRLTPPMVRHEIRTRVALPEARVRVVDLEGNETVEDILLLMDPVDGLPFPPNFKRWDRAKSEQLCRLLKSTVKRVEELSNFQGMWPSIMKTVTLNLKFSGASDSAIGSIDGPPHMSMITYDITRMLSVSMSSSSGPVPGESSRPVATEGLRAMGLMRKQRVVIEEDDEGGPDVD